MENFSTSNQLFIDFLKLAPTPWEALTELNKYIDQLFQNPPEGFVIDGNLLKGKNVKVGDNLEILDKAVLLDGSEVSSNSILRGGVILGQDSFIGHGIEIKHSVIMDYTRIPHLNYVADSVIGSRCNFGAGSITANWKGGFKILEISVTKKGQKINTGLEKLGSIIGDDVYLGCNVVLNPGTIVGKNTHIYPLSLIGGEIPSDVIVKNHTNLEIVKKN